MSHWQAIAAWIIINIVIGIFGPLIVGSMFVEYLANRPKITLRTFYGKGELAFASLVIGLSVIVDLLKSPFCGNAVELAVAGFGVLAFIAAQTWAVPLCHDLLKSKKVVWDEVWRDSWVIALGVFSVGTVA